MLLAIIILGYLAVFWYDKYTEYKADQYANKVVRRYNDDGTPKI